MLEKKFYGCLLGGALGDAAGYPSEGRTYETVQGSRKSDVFYQPTWSGRLNELIPAGRVTDGTILAMVLGESLARRGRVDLHDQAVEMYRAFRTSGQGRGWGQATVQALHNIRTGLPLDKCGVVGAAGNGTAERAAPLGLWHVHGTLEDIVKDAALIAPLTHRDPRAVVGMALQAEAVRYLANCDSRTFDVKLFFQHIKESAVRLEQRFGIVNTFVPAITVAGNCLDVGLPEVFDHLEPGEYVRDTFSFSLWVFGRHPTDIRAAVLEAANAGGDADSTALMAANMGGALVGVNQIPSELFMGLEKVEQIRKIAQDLYSAVQHRQNEKK